MASCCATDSFIFQQFPRVSRGDIWFFSFCCRSTIFGFSQKDRIIFDELWFYQTWVLIRSFLENSKRHGLETGSAFFFPFSKRRVNTLLHLNLLNYIFCSWMWVVPILLLRFIRTQSRNNSISLGRWPNLLTLNLRFVQIN